MEKNYISNLKRVNNSYLVNTNFEEYQQALKRNEFQQKFKNMEQRLNMLEELLIKKELKISLN